jgi:hypothetical protein
MIGRSEHSSAERGGKETLTAAFERKESGTCQTPRETNLGYAYAARSSLFSHFPTAASAFIFARCEKAR